MSVETASEAVAEPVALDPRVARSRAAILAAVQDLIVERSVRECTIDAIVERTGIARTTLYRHWPSRAALLEHAVEALSQSWPLRDTGALRGDLIELFNTRAPHLMAEPGEPRRRPASALLETANSEPGDDRIAAVVRRSVDRSFRILIERARARGEVRPELDINAMVNMLTGAALDRRNLPQGASTRAYVLDTIDILVRGARP